MKNIVVADQYSQSDLKPSDLLQQYLNMLPKDVTEFLSTSAVLTKQCPACNSLRGEPKFIKFGLQYHECDACATWYVVNRPSDEAISNFYRQAPSRQFWRNQLSEASRQQRKEKIIKPRFEWMMDSIMEHCPKAEHWVDVHTSQKRYVEAMAAMPIAQKSLLSPYCEGTLGNITRIDKPWWQADGLKAQVISVFEVLDHTSDVAGLMTAVRGMLNSGGLCFITTILSSGFDVKELGGQAPNIFPPDRLNVFSAKGLKALLERNGFECLEFSTPGILDVAIVAKALKENPDITVSPFVRDLVLNQDDDVRKSFQEFLQANMLSSYGRILVRKV